MRPDHHAVPGWVLKPTRRLFTATACGLLLATTLFPASAQRKPGAPILSRFESFKVTQQADREELEPAAGTIVTAGDTVQYVATHRNVSGKRLLEVDFGIPIPPGTTYVDSSAQPEGARLARLDKHREQMVWRVPKIEPGEIVVLRLRVLVSPDPTLVPLPAQPRRPELRRN